jgi:hypothetical protein
MVTKPRLLPKKDKSQINTLERKGLRRIFGPVNDRGIWGIRSNKELADLYEEIDLAILIKTLRLRWLGHVCTMEEHRNPKKDLEEKPGEEGREGSHVQGGLIMLKMI